MELPTCVLPDAAVAVCDAIRVCEAEKSIQLLMHSIQATSVCPICAQPSARIHSHYQRTLADLPWAQVSVQVKIQVRRFFCDHAACPRRIFAERLPAIAQAWSRRTDVQNMGLVYENNAPNFYHGKVRVVDFEGEEICKYEPREYAEYVAEHVEPWSYLKFPYLKKRGWKGFVEGIDSSIYCATPLSRLNVADRMATPKAQEAFEEMYGVLGAHPCRALLAQHWSHRGQRPHVDYGAEARDAKGELTR